MLKDLAIQVNVLPDRLAQAMEYKLAEHHVIAMPGEEDEEEENDEQLIENTTRLSTGTIRGWSY